MIRAEHLSRQSAHREHGEGDHRHHRGRADVGLDDDERAPEGDRQRPHRELTPVAEFVVVVLDQPRDEEHREELEQLRRLEVDHVQVEPPLAAVAGHADGAHREQESETEDDEHRRRAHQSIESHARGEVRARRCPKPRYTRSWIMIDHVVPPLAEA